MAGGLISTAVFLLVGLALRVKPWIIIVSAALTWGGAIGNQVELGLFDYATDWLWVSGDMAALLLWPLGVSESGVMNHR